MRVLFLAPASSIHTIRWVNTLANCGQDVLLVSLPDHHANNTEIDDRVRVKYLKIHGLKGYYLNCIQIK